MELPTFVTKRGNTMATWRALRDLEKRGLIVVERRCRKSPIVRLKLSHPRGKMCNKFEA